MERELKCAHIEDGRQKLKTTPVIPKSSFPDLIDLSLTLSSTWNTDFVVRVREMVQRYPDKCPRSWSAHSNCARGVITGSSVQMSHLLKV